MKELNMTPDEQARAIKAAKVVHSAMLDSDFWKEYEMWANRRADSLAPKVVVAPAQKPH